MRLFTFPGHIVDTRSMISVRRHGQKQGAQRRLSAVQMTFCEAGISMIPKHALFHIVLFIVAMNGLFCCPGTHAFVEDTLQKSCCVFSHAEVKKKYCQAPCKHDITPSAILHPAQDLFSAPASNRLCVGVVLPPVNTPSPFQGSMRLNV